MIYNICCLVQSTVDKRKATNDVINPRMFENNTKADCLAFNDQANRVYYVCTLQNTIIKSRIFKDHASLFIYYRSWRAWESFKSGPFCNCAVRLSFTLWHLWRLYIKCFFIRALSHPRHTLQRELKTRQSWSQMWPRQLGSHIQCTAHTEWREPTGSGYGMGALCPSPH